VADVGAAQEARVGRTDHEEHVSVAAIPSGRRQQPPPLFTC
jgi:hypothetical protein